MSSIRGWLLLYLIATPPILAFWSAGLSGWVLDYPLRLFAGILVVFLVPLALLVLKLSTAPIWNIALLWASAGLLLLRILSAVWMMERGLQGFEALTMAGIICFAIAWSVVWIWYFLVSKRVANTFGEQR